MSTSTTRATEALETARDKLAEAIAAEEAKRAELSTAERGLGAATDSGAGPSLAKLRAELEALEAQVAHRRQAVTDAQIAALEAEADEADAEAAKVRKAIEKHDAEVTSKLEELAELEEISEVPKFSHGKETPKSARLRLQIEGLERQAHSARVKADKLRAGAAVVAGHTP